MSSVFYKFKSTKDYDSYKFDGAGVPVWELKREIIQSKKLGKSNDFDLILTNSQTNEDYKDETEVIPKNSQIIVKRVPAVGGGKGRSSITSFQPRNPISAPVRSFVPSSVGGTDEESKIKAMMAANVVHWEQNLQEMPIQQMGPRKLFRPNNWRGQTTTPPDTYICFRCGQKGHYIQNCPTNADPSFDKNRVRKTTGIPKTFLKPAKIDPESSGGVLVTPEGNLVVATPNEKEWDRLSVIKAISEKSLSIIPNEKIPDDLKCKICSNLVKSAIQLQCCNGIVCEECVSKLFEESIEYPDEYSVKNSVKPNFERISIKCPICNGNITHEKVIPDEVTRLKVQKYIDEYLLEQEREEEIKLEDKLEGKSGDGDPTKEEDTIANNNTETNTHKSPSMMPLPPPMFPPLPFMFPPPPPPGVNARHLPLGLMIPPFLPPLPQHPPVNISKSEIQRKPSPPSSKRPRSKSPSDKYSPL